MHVWPKPGPPRAAVSWPGPFWRRGVSPVRGVFEVVFRDDMDPEETLLLGTLKEPPGGSQAFLTPTAELGRLRALRSAGFAAARLQ